MPIDPREFGFKEGEIVLPGLEHQMKLPQGVLFNYAGEVDSLLDHAAQRELLLQRGFQKSPYWFINLLDSQVRKTVIKGIRSALRDKIVGAAYCHEHGLLGRRREKRDRVFEIAKLKGLHAGVSVFMDGFESAEFLVRIAQRGELQKILAEAGIDLNALSLKDRDFKDAGGLMALHQWRAKGRTVEIPIFDQDDEQERVGEDIIKAFGF